MKLIVGDHTNSNGQAIAHWYINNQKLPVCPPYSAMLWANDSGPVCAAIFNCFNGSSIEVHFYGPKGLTRQVLHDIAMYVYLQLRCNILIAKIPRANTFKKYLSRIGFKYCAIIPSYFGPHRSGDAIMYYAKKDNILKWIK